MKWCRLRELWAEHLKLPELSDLLSLQRITSSLGPHKVPLKHARHCESWA